METTRTDQQAGDCTSGKDAAAKTRAGHCHGGTAIAFAAESGEICGDACNQQAGPDAGQRAAERQDYDTGWERKYGDAGQGDAQSPRW